MFFQKLSEILNGTAVTIRIMPKNGKLTIGVVPDGIANVVPLNTTGTPEMLDAEFLEIIKAPLSTAAGVAANIAEFEASVKKAEPKNGDPKKADAKGANTKKATPAKAEEQTDEEVDAELSDEEEDGDEQPAKPKKKPVVKQITPPLPEQPAGPVQLMIG